MTRCSCLCTLGIAVSFVGVTPLPAQQSDQAMLDAFAESLDSLVPALLAELATPGAAVALIRDGQVTLMRGYGWADRDARRPVTPETLFNIGSISKTVAAWGLMLLVQHDRLDLDTPVETYLTRWHLPPSEFDNRDVTLRRLLSHTAGLSLHGYPGFDPAVELPSVEESLSGATNGVGGVRVIIQPGTEWRYSGGGFTIAQLLAEEVTGRPFHEFMRTDVLQPLGMTASAYVWNAMVDSLAATPYGPLGPIPGPRFTAQAAAGLQTSLHDFTRFALASLSSARPELATSVLAPETVRRMQQPAPSAPDYGLGYQVFEVLDGAHAVGHGGSNAGWQARFLVIPTTGDGLVVMTNSTLGWNVHSYLFCRWGQAALGESGTCRKGIGAVMAAAVARDGVAQAVQLYRTLRRPAQDAYRFREGDLNTLGYALLGEGRVADAVAVFELNVEAYPDEWNPHDSLGDAYLAAGDTAAAIASYERSLERNPENRHAVRILERLRRQ